MSDWTPEQRALATFLQALALTISNFDDLPPEGRSSANFIRGFDGYLGEMVKAAEAEGDDVRENVDVLRSLLEKVFKQLERLTTKSPAVRVAEGGSAQSYAFPSFELVTSMKIRILSETIITLLLETKKASDHEVPTQLQCILTPEQAMSIGSSLQAAVVDLQGKRGSA